MNQNELNELLEETENTEVFEESSLEDELLMGLACTEMNCPHGVYPVCGKEKDSCPYILEKTLLKEENDMIDEIFEKDIEDGDIQMTISEDIFTVKAKVCEDCILNHRILGISEPVKVTNIRKVQNGHMINYENKGKKKVIMCSENILFCKLK